MTDYSYIVTGYGAGRVHIQEPGGNALKTRCGRQLRDGMTRLTAADVRQHYPGTWACERCFAGTEAEAPDTPRRSARQGLDAPEGCAPPSQAESYPMTATMRVGDYYVREEHEEPSIIRRGEVRLEVLHDDDDPDGRGLRVTVHLPWPAGSDQSGWISYGGMPLHDADHAEALGLALDRAATILREAREALA